MGRGEQQCRGRTQGHGGTPGHRGKKRRCVPDRFGSSATPDLLQSSDQGLMVEVFPRGGKLGDNWEATFVRNADFFYQTFGKQHSDSFFAPNIGQKKYDASFWTPGDDSQLERESPLGQRATPQGNPHRWKLAGSLESGCNSFPRKVVTRQVSGWPKATTSRRDKSASVG